MKPQFLCDKDNSELQQLLGLLFDFVHQGALTFTQQHLGPIRGWGERGPSKYSIIQLIIQVRDNEITFKTNILSVL